MKSEKKSSDRIFLQGGGLVEIFAEKGKLHNTDGPAVRVVHADGTVVEVFCEYGSIENADRPSVTVKVPGYGSAEVFHGPRRPNDKQNLTPLN